VERWPWKDLGKAGLLYGLFVKLPR
jgi:hypothetical protein